MAAFRQFLFLLLVAIVLVFVFQNTEVVEVRFLTWEVSTSRALLLLITFFFGIAAGWVSRRKRRQ